MADISQMTFPNVFSSMKMFEFFKISLKFVPKGQINNIPALVQIMAWRRSGDKPLSEPMMVSLPTHICVTRPQRVNASFYCVIDCPWHASLQAAHMYNMYGLLIKDINTTLLCWLIWVRHSVPLECMYYRTVPIDTLRPRLNDRQLADDILKSIFINCWI